MDHFLQVVVASAVVLGLIYISLRAVNSLMSGRLSGGQLEVIEAIAVGRRAQVVLVRAGDKHLVLGVTDGCVQRLEELDLAHQVTISEEKDAVSAGGTAWDRIRDTVSGMFSKDRYHT